MKHRNCTVCALALLVLALTASQSLAQSSYTPYTFTTFAGRVNNSGSADGTGSAAQFSDPLGVAVDGAGNVYVVDNGNRTIRKVTPAGVGTTLAGHAAKYCRASWRGRAARQWV